MKPLFNCCKSFFALADKLHHLFAAFISITKLLIFFVLFGYCTQHTVSNIHCTSCHLKEKVTAAFLDSNLSIKPAGTGVIDTTWYADEKLLSVQSCEGCHKKETDEWKQSSHGQAWTNPVFF